MIVIRTTQAVKIAKFTIQREGNQIWLSSADADLSGNADDWREIVRQVSALLEPAKAEAAPEETPDPRGYVLIDEYGDAWGWRDRFPWIGSQEKASRPFRTKTEAASESNQYAVGGFPHVEVWTPESCVPPMPETRP